MSTFAPNNPRSTASPAASVAADREARRYAVAHAVSEGHVGVLSMKRRLQSPWPFPMSVTATGKVLQNLPPKPRKPARLKKLPPADQWTQEALL